MEGTGVPGGYPRRIESIAKKHGLFDAKTRVFGFAPVSQSGDERGGEPACFWQMQQSARTRAQLHAGSDGGRRAGPGDGNGAGPEGVEGNSGAGNYAADGSPVFELRGGRAEGSDSDLREYRAG